MNLGSINRYDKEDPMVSNEQVACSRSIRRIQVLRYQALVPVTGYRGIRKADSGIFVLCTSV